MKERRKVVGVRNGLRVVSGAQATSGETEQLIEALYHEHAGVLYAFALRMTNSRERAEDVVQETLIRAWRNAEALTGANGSPRAYLFASARSVIIDMWRADRSRPVLVAGEGAESVLDRTSGDEDALEDMLRSWQIAEALDRLSKEHREVLVAIQLRGLSVNEASKALGVPAGTIKSRTYYALRALRIALEEMGVSQA